MDDNKCIFRDVLESSSLDNVMQWMNWQKPEWTL